MKKNPRIAIVGATGAVGQEILKLIESREYAFSELKLVASSRSAGKTVEYQGKSYVVENLETFDFSRTDIAFFSAGTSTSQAWAAKAASQGALVIDNTNAFRMDPLSPLVVPQVNSGELAKRPRSGVIANPNCSTIQMVRVLKPIHERFGLERVIVSTYQAASGGGMTGIEELRADAQAVIEGREASAPPKKRFPRPLAFNAVPQVDVFLENGFTLEEQKMVQETRKILGLPELRLTATAVRVPVVNGHSEAVYVETKEPVTLAGLRETLGLVDEVKLYGTHDPSDYPTARFIDRPDHVHVGRLRVDPQNPNGFWCWIVADNLWVGAALNALQIAERLPSETVS
jgi:aspartate-semialdehyde dehydrogenase